MTHSEPDVLDGELELADLPTAVRHRLLQSDRRGVTLSILTEKSAPISLDDLAAGVAVREDESSIPTPEHHNQAKVALHHNPFPLMDDLGSIDYDLETKQVTT